MSKKVAFLIGTGIGMAAYVAEECIRYHKNNNRLPIDDQFWQSLRDSVTADCNHHSELYSDKQFVRATDDSIDILSHDRIVTIRRKEKSVIVVDLHGKKRFDVPSNIETDVAVAYIGSYVHNIINN